MTIFFTNHLDMVSCWDEAGRPLDAELVENIESVAAEAEYLGRSSEWVCFRGKCRICNFEQNIMCPAENDLDNQECENCGHHTLQVKENSEWEE